MDWKAFFDTHRIPYVTSGPNVAKGHVCIHCVWCGADDEGQHLSVNLEGKGFRCWRNPRKHVGKNPTKLVQALLNCSWEQAAQLSGQQKVFPSDFMAKVRSAIQSEAFLPGRIIYPKIPQEFKVITTLPSAKPFVNYLERRGFTKHNIFYDAADYDIYYARTGNYRGRIIFTVWHDQKLVGWTGRTIYTDEALRYKTLTSNKEKALEHGEIAAPNPISHYLLFLDHVLKSDADTIVLCEGPFDAWRVNLLGEKLGVVATCFFTSMLSNEQLNLLHEILPKFKNRLLLLDKNTFAKSAQIRSDLIALDVAIRRLPEGVKDPGEIISRKVLRDCLQL